MYNTNNPIQSAIENQSADPFGCAILDFARTQQESSITVHSPLFDDDTIDVKYLFRTAEQMSELEQEALSLCHGKVLDIGAGAGCHTLELQKRGIDVEALDISQLAVHAMRMLGVRNTTHKSVIDIEGQYDTLLMLMNGIGIAGSIAGLELLLPKLHSLLDEGGSVILDSSDIRYLYEDEDGSFEIDLNAGYYGEIDYQMSYGTVRGVPFKWLYVDFDTLDFYASKHGFKAKFMTSSEDGYSYLAVLTK